MVPSAASFTRGATAAPSVSSASTTGSWLSKEVFLPEAAPSSDSLFLQEILYHSNEKTSRTKSIFETFETFRRLSKALKKFSRDQLFRRLKLLDRLLSSK